MKATGVRPEPTLGRSRMSVSQLTPRLRRVDRRQHVVIAGAGIAALEALLAVRALAAERVAITLLAPEDRTLYTPVTVGEAFGRSEARSFDVTEIAVTQDAAFLADRVEEVNLEDRRVHLESGESVRYDSLVIATGGLRVSTLPGALTFRGRRDVPALQSVLEELVAGHAKSVTFTLTRKTAWSLPLYELAALTAAHLREHGSHSRVVIATPEETPLELFGRAAEEALAPLLTSLEIHLRCGVRPSAVRPRQLMLAGGASVMTDRVVTLPEVVGPALKGLPSDEHGFVPVDRHGRVAGARDVYAAGDVTMFPFKQGGLATQQADAVAEMIAAAAGVALRPQPFRPVLRGLLMTDGAPLYLRAEPQHLAWPSSVAIDARPRPVVPSHRASTASGQALWWPPAKVAGRYLAPYLAAMPPVRTMAGSLADRAAIPGGPLDAAEHRDAVEMALLLAEGDARWGDYRSALHALDTAQALEGALPAEYEAKRLLWLAELDSQP